jgi:type IV pilus assembly protein PilW
MHIHAIKTGFNRGFSLVELMVAVTIGLLMLTGLTATFVSSNKARTEIEKSNQQLENGRYAIEVLTEDLRLAGYYGELDGSRLTPPTTIPDPCATLATDLTTALPIAVQGYDNSTSLSCLDDVKSETDVIVVRRASTCVIGETGCDAQAAGAPYIQVTRCSSQSGTPFELNTDTSALSRKKIDCVTAADLRRYYVHIYFVANNDNPGDGRPTLKRAELSAGGWTIVPLVEGIENLQFEYGLDTDCDGNPDVYNAAPESYVATYSPSCSIPTSPVWVNTTSVKLNVLARNTEATNGYTDTKTYVLGNNADNTVNTYGPRNDSYKRHAYQAIVRLNNVIGRRQ